MSEQYETCTDADPSNTPGVHRGEPSRPLVLASGSRFRARVLTEAGIDVSIEAPDIDERALDAELASTGPEEHALGLAEAKARSVAERLGLGDGTATIGGPVHRYRRRAPSAGESLPPLIIGADQLGVLGEGNEPLILHKRSDAGEAVDQLMSMSGTSHRLVNGLVVLDTSSGEVHRGIDVMTVTMREFTREEASAYVERFRPFDSAGSYRIEDQDLMDPADRFITGVEGEDPSGVLGMPLPLLRRLLHTAGAWNGPR